jgi:hypothetical protein
VVGSEALALFKPASPEVLSPTAAAGISVSGATPDLLNLGVWLLLRANLCELYGLLVQIDGCVVLHALAANGVDDLRAALIKLPRGNNLAPWLSGARVDCSQDMVVVFIGRCPEWELKYEHCVGIEVKSRFLAS